MNSSNSKQLLPVIAINEAACVNCHMCISVCPVKYCIDGSGDKVSINADVCIGCGACVKACKANARSILDDTARFFADLATGVPMVAIAAPALASSFPVNYMRLLGWLKSIGVHAVFDVSFGAELTVKSYLHHIKQNKPELVIAQPCPAIVNYIELYQPELLPHLAPADSPMLHTAKMVRRFYPQYERHRIAVLSPCAAKKREFAATGIAEYNVTIRSIKDYLDGQHIRLDRFTECDFDNPPAERAVLFSTPGGLLRTVEREVPGAANIGRKIEGRDLVYPYLDSLKASLDKKITPLLVDCLNCSYGCNAGPGTLNQEKSADELEHAVEQRAVAARKRYGGNALSDGKARKRLGKVLARYWEKDLYARRYVDRSSNWQLRQPSDPEIKKIYADLLKQTVEDHLNCAACGYNSCQGMAVAIFNGLNKVENCHLFRQRMIEREQEQICQTNERLHREIDQATGQVAQIRGALTRLDRDSAEQFAAVEESAAAVEQMIATLGSASAIAGTKRSQMSRLMKEAAEGERDMNETIAVIRKAASGVSGIGGMIDVIHDVADKTNLLAMNAAIQAAHAGSAGKSFAVVAVEIRKLAETTGRNVNDIAATLKSIIDQIRLSDDMTGKTGTAVHNMVMDVSLMTDEIGALIDSFTELSSGGSQVTKGIEELRTISMDLKEVYSQMVENVNGILDRINVMMQIANGA